MKWGSEMDLKYVGSQLNMEVLKKYEVIRIRKVSKFVHDVTGNTLIEFITNHDDWKYDAPFLKRVFTGFESADSKIDFDGVKNINYILDHRGRDEFFRNLMLGWVVEDLTRFFLSGNGINVRLFESVKSKRSINKRPKQLPDLVIMSNNKNYFIEVVQTFMNEFNDKHVLRMRGRKYEKLVKYNADVLVYDFSGDEVLLSLFNIVNDVDSADFVTNAIVGKPGYIVRVKNDVECFECSIDEVVEVIKNRI